MLSRKFYDIITIVFIILLILIMGLQFYSDINNFTEKTEERNQACLTSGLRGQELYDCLAQKSTLDLIYKNGIYFLGFIYYLFILALAINLHSKGKKSLSNTIVVAIFVPFAVIFYFTALRKQLKEFEKEQTNETKID